MMSLTSGYVLVAHILVKSGRICTFRCDQSQSENKTKKLDVVQFRLDVLGQYVLQNTYHCMYVPGMDQKTIPPPLRAKTREVGYVHIGSVQLTGKCHTSAVLEVLMKESV